MKKEMYMPSLLTIFLAFAVAFAQVGSDRDRSLLPPLTSFHPLKVEKMIESTHEIQQLIETFAPLVVVHKDDTSTPTSVPWYLNHTTLKARLVRPDHRQEFMQTTLTEHPDPETLAQAPMLFEEELKPLFQEKESHTSSMVEFFLEPDKPVETVYKGEGGDAQQFSTPCYANVTRLPDVVEKTNFDAVAIQYLLFYAYQDGISPASSAFSWLTKRFKIGIHEGDWEFVTVILRKDKDNATAPYIIDKVAPSQHGDSDAIGREQVTFVNNVLKETRDGTHPVIYAAKNSHANYLKPIPRTNKVLDSTSCSREEGKLWRCWDNPQFIGYHPMNKQSGDKGHFESTLQPGMEWMQANLRWGSTLENHLIIPLGFKDLDIETHGNAPGTPNSAWYLIPGQSPPERKIP